MEIKPTTCDAKAVNLATAPNWSSKRALKYFGMLNVLKYG